MLTRLIATGVALLLTTSAAAATNTTNQAAARKPVAAAAMPASTAAPAAVASVVQTAMADQRASHAPAMTAADVQTFFDSLVPYAMHRDDVAGGVIVVVADGKVLFARGYGYADLKTRQRPSPQTTLFRPGSISKLFTWTAVMQLVEQGKLNLDQDINRYLDFRIPPYHGQPITLRQLMTHTPGFADTGRGLFPAPGTHIDLGRYLKTHLPPRIFPPGKITAYSNYGAGLAGYIVQRVSGERFADYIDRHIFKPLGMRHSSFAQPLPANLAPLMAKGYRSASDGQPQPFELVDPAPAGALSTSAMDVARFMLAQLNQGSYNGTQILIPATTRLMHSPQHTAAPGLNGFDLGFYQENRNGQRIIGHAGDTLVFHSDLHLMLDAHVGMFMSFNGGKGNATELLRKAIFRGFLDRYFPYSPASLPTATTAKTDSARAAGWYLPSRRMEGALRIRDLAQAPVSARPDGTLELPFPPNDAGKPTRWREIGPLRYQQVNGRAHLDFVTDKMGRIRYWTTDDFPPVEVFQRVSRMHSTGTVGPLVLLATLVFLTTMLVWLGGAWIRRHYRRSLDLPAGRRLPRLLSRLGVLALLLTFCGWIAFVLTAGANGELLLVNGKLVPWLYPLYVLGVLALLGVVAIVVNSVRTWLRPRRGWWVRAGETLLGLSALYMGWFILAFGLVSFSTRY